MEGRSFRTILQDELNQRQARNPGYSLRAFARDLGAPASKVSSYLNGKGGLSAARSRQLADRLRLVGAAREIFVLSATAAHSRSRTARQAARESLARLQEGRFAELQIHAFECIRDWYHMAILELTSLEGFQSDEKWLAKRLGLSIGVVKAAVKRLESLGLLARDGSRWHQTGADLKTPCDVPNQAVREHHRQILELAAVSLESDPVTLREITSMQFAVDPERLPVLKQAIRDFQEKLSQLAEQGGHRNEVYALGVQLFPLTRSEGSAFNSENEMENSL